MIKYDAMARWNIVSKTAHGLALAPETVGKQDTAEKMEI
jgi:hypothetical protein